MPEVSRTTYHAKDTLKRVLIGSWNAVKPEHQGKKVLEFYEKLRFPKYTDEEKKVADRIYLLLKTHSNAVGVGAIVGETAVAAAVVWGYTRLKHHKKSLLRSQEGQPAEKISGEVLSVDDYLQNTLVPRDTAIGIVMDEGVETWGIEKRILDILGYHDEDRVGEMAFLLGCAARVLDPMKPNELQLGDIGTVLLDPKNFEKMNELANHTPLESGFQAFPVDPHVVIDRLRFLFRDAPGGSDLFTYWGRVLRFTGLHALIPGGTTRTDGGAGVHRVLTWLYMAMSSS